MIWVDAHLSPAIAKWLNETFGHPACSLRAVGLRHASDLEIYEAARAADVIFMTKDNDFVELLERRGPPPRILWLTCGNTSHGALCGLLSSKIRAALDLLEAGSPLVEIGF